MLQLILTPPDVLTLLSLNSSLLDSFENVPT